MSGGELKIIEELRQLCSLAGIDFGLFLKEMKVVLKNRIKRLLTPNNKWFQKGKTFERYWKFLELITGHQWRYEDVEYWYKMLRSPSETREEIPPVLRYKSLHVTNPLVKNAAEKHQKSS